MKMSYFVKEVGELIVLQAIFFLLNTFYSSYMKSYIVSMFEEHCSLLKNMCSYLEAFHWSQQKRILVMI